MFWLVQILVPIFVVVVLPVTIVWIVFRSATNKDNKNAEIVMKAIETNPDIDTDKLVEALGKPRKNALQILHARLLRGCIYTLFGIFSALGLLINNYAGHDEDLSTLFLILSVATLPIGIAYLIVYFITRNSVVNAGESCNNK